MDAVYKPIDDALKLALQRAEAEESRYRASIGQWTDSRENRYCQDQANIYLAISDFIRATVRFCERLSHDAQ